MVEIDIGNGLIAKINEETHTSFITSSPKATGNVFIPKYAEFECSQYNIISIGEKAFKNNSIKSLTFPNDSEVISFEPGCFYDSHIQKLQIPPKLQGLKEGIFNYIYDLNDIEVSKQNTLFLYAEKKYLLGKSDSNSNKFDILYYVRYDIRKAVIPFDVTIFHKKILTNKPKLKTLQFQENPDLKEIGPQIFCESTFSKLIWPSTIEKVDSTNFKSLCALNKIKFTSTSQHFIYYDNKYLLTKSSDHKFDVLLFANRDIDCVQIPQQVREIGFFALQSQKLKSLKFDQNSIVEKISYAAFEFISGLGCIILPESVTRVEGSAFYGVDNLLSVTFNSKSIYVDLSCVYQCRKMTNLFFPKATTLTLDCPESLFGFAMCKINVRKTAKLNGTALERCKDRISYY